MSELDIFETEQQIYDEALACAGESAAYKKLVKEYGKLLKQLRRSTRIADRTTTNLNESNVDLNDKIHYDALTGIHNRRYLEENLPRVIQSVSRAEGELSVLMMDIDFFKRYNDTYGHDEGDKCLKAVAAAMQESVSRTDDFVARYGGEEFAAVLPNTNERGARVIANTILENIRAKKIPHENNEAASYVTISIGVTTGEAERTQRSVNYIKRADEALYMSKGNGRNQYSYIHFKEEE